MVLCRVDQVILGTFLIGKIRAAALRQKKDERVRHFLIVDEAVDFMHDGMNFPKLFSQARKMKLSLVLAQQHITQMPDKIKESAFANSGVLVSFNVDVDDAKIFASRMENVDPHDITRQQRGECIARIDNEPYFVRTRLPIPPSADQTVYIEDRMRQMNSFKPQRQRGSLTAGKKQAKLASTRNVQDQVLVCEGVV